MWRRNSNAEEVAAGIGALKGVLASVHALDDFLVETVGRASAPSFDPLIKALDKGVRLFEGIGGAGAEAARRRTAVADAVERGNGGRSTKKILDFRRHPVHR